MEEQGVTALKNQDILSSLTFEKFVTENIIAGFSVAPCSNLQFLAHV